MRTQHRLLFCERQDCISEARLAHSHLASQAAALPYFASRFAFQSARDFSISGHSRTVHSTISLTGTSISLPRSVIVYSTRSGAYSVGPAHAMDFQEDYLRSVLGFIGLKDVSFVRAAGVAMGEDAVKEAMQTVDTHLLAALDALA